MKPDIATDPVVELAARVDRVETLALADHEARRQRARDYQNQTIGFVAGVVYAALIFYIIRR